MPLVSPSWREAQRASLRLCGVALKAVTEFIPFADAAHEKELGNAAYTGKDFETALTHYRTASELEPSSVVYMNNMAAAYFGMKNYQVWAIATPEAPAMRKTWRATVLLGLKLLPAGLHRHVQKGR